MTAPGRWLQLRRTVQPLFAPEVRPQTLARLAVILVLVLALNGLNVVNSYVGRGFMTALADRQVDAFSRYALYYLTVFALSTVVAVFYQFFQDRLALFWRQRLTEHLLQQYLLRQAFYHLREHAEIDNPDQRLSEDVRSFTTTLLSFMLLVLNSAITVVSFAVILWSISQRLFFSAIGYALIGSLMTLWLGRRLVNLNFQQLAKEANLRYGLVRIREHAEPIALLRGETEEDRRVRSRLADVVEVVRRMIGVNRNMALFTSFFNYLAPILPVIIVAPAYLRGEIEFGEVTQSAMAFAQFLGGLAVFIAQFGNISNFAAVVTRLGALQEGIHDAQAPVHDTILMRKDDARVAFEHLTLQTPNGDRVLIRDLSLDIPRGRRLLVRGKDGAGKSALFRATAGLWSGGSGTVICPSRDQIVFVPQKPYIAAGTLREQLLYGLRDNDISDSQLQAVLRGLKLDLVVKRIGGLDVERNLPVTLSMGEQQQLAFARLLLANPRFAFLDQAINSLEPQRGQQLYQLLAATTISYLSVDDHIQIQEYHDTILELAEDGSWRTHPSRMARPA